MKRTATASPEVALCCRKLAAPVLATPCLADPPLAAIAVPFGRATPPELTILPVALAASAIGRGAVGGVLLLFGGATMATFIGLTVIATLAGYQIQWPWLDQNATTMTSFVLLVIAIVACVGI